MRRSEYVFKSSKIHLDALSKGNVTVNSNTLCCSSSIVIVYCTWIFMQLRTLLGLSVIWGINKCILFVKKKMQSMMPPFFGRWVFEVWTDLRWPRSLYHSLNLISPVDHHCMSTVMLIWLLVSGWHCWLVGEDKTGEGTIILECCAITEASHEGPSCRFSSGCRRGVLYVQL